MNKVFFLIGAIPPQTGGEIYNYKLFQYLELSGYDVDCCSLHKRLSVRLAKIPFIGNILTNTVLACLLYRDTEILVEDHFFTKNLLFNNIVHRFIKGKKIIILLHSLYGYDSGDTFLIRKWINGIKHKIRLSLADTIITNSEYSKREIVSLGIDTSIVHLLPPGIDRKKLRIVTPTDGQKTDCILCVANYLVGKGLIYLIEAFSLVNRKKFTLHLVGNPSKSSSYYKQMNKYVQKSNLIKDVFFHNGADKENIYKLYSSADIFVLPTLKETFGIVLIEAMHYGLPIITTNVGAIPELITDGENGFLVPPANSQKLAEAISKLIENPELRKEMGAKGRQRVSDSYYWEQTCSKFLSIVQTING
ncbi:glycosyltransferase family 4 protein [Aetokthonos hydrillicola Thurmond2011]|jgi:glycosyltransferase involved in cell wall biosynthesis|uniref:Glycosyltransferase family 4 protein n=1 Tax=Aetokthonos hydrillicola Thurmond2011 TaxID=2712845 RepID=A0AAP5I690_9CYAN|nr:glycosyltransferase family 4 protein [Aetokthonos hydrillicola]MBO3458289.1 glycosyltransferase family 4 protein [Aetokthonos hydrillicola CCALA 1050]MBW4585851.1 glycosyltransferase family 4 protein [Aetokthonos hydrillicola CCALA 1050]MDR9893923.1 glycosyltransferase family 4 protein [Aetokthonos hydrillicola Thurmond2011]